MTVRSIDDLRAKIREVPDFPKPGILFYDITTLLREADAFHEVIDRMADAVKDERIDLVVGMESRGFIFAAPLADRLGAGFVPVRKLGKLPAETMVSIHTDATEGDSGMNARKRSLSRPMLFAATVCSKRCHAWSRPSPASVIDPASAASRAGLSPITPTGDPSRCPVIHATARSPRSPTSHEAPWSGSIIRG